jgi:hypothetical protein
MNGKISHQKWAYPAKPVSISDVGKVLGRVRLSRLTDESTSESRQREVIEQWAASHDHEIVAWD